MTLCLDHTAPTSLIHLTETTSTNTYLQTLCARQPVPEWTTVVADYQTGGRGQRGNSWEAAPGRNLLFSLVLYPLFLEARQQFRLSQIVSLAIKEELDRYIPAVSIKWPNDIYYREQKLCGILIENDLMGRHISRSIVGVGLNINQERFTSPAPNPVSLVQITGTTHPLQPILQDILQRLGTYYARLRRGEAAEIDQLYARALFRRHGLHPYRDAHGTFRAQLLGVEADGRLRLRDEAGTERSYMFKEIEYLLM